MKMIIPRSHNHYNIVVYLRNNFQMGRFFIPIYKEQNNRWMLGNMNFIPRVDQDF